MHCLNPIRIKNPYSGEYMFVPCGKCDGCRIDKANNMSRRISNELACHSYNLFFTLTYDNFCMPFIKLNNDGYCDKIYNVCSISYDPVSHDRLVSCHTEQLDFCFDEIPYYPPTNHFYGSNCVGVLYKKHFQDFIRAIRDSLFNYYGKRIQLRYYLVGEYGTSKHRPHAHGLFFFDSWEIADHVQKLIYEVWKYCAPDRIETKYLDGEKFGYLSSYIGCRRDSDGVLQIRDFREFQLFSKRPLFGVHPCENEILQGYVDGTNIEPFRKVYGQSVDYSTVFTLSQSVLRSYFPRFRGIRDLDDTILFTIIRENKPDNEGQHRFSLAARRFLIKYFGRYSDNLIYIYLEIYHKVYSSLHSYLCKQVNEQILDNITFDKIVDFYLHHYNSLQTEDIALTKQVFDSYMYYLKQFDIKLDKDLMVKFIDSVSCVLPRNYFKSADEYVFKYKTMLAPKHTSNVINNF